MASLRECLCTYRLARVMNVMHPLSKILVGQVFYYLGQWSNAGYGVSLDCSGKTLLRTDP